MDHALLFFFPWHELHPMRIGATAAKTAKQGRCKEMKKSQSNDWLEIIGSGEWNRTTGLQVMSLTSYLCSTPQYF